MISNRHFYIDGDNYDIVPAEVMYVNYKGNDVDTLYAIGVRLLYTAGSTSLNSVIIAKPFDISIKKIPLIGEIVYLMKGINAESSGGVIMNDNYYIQSPIAMKSNINYNAMIGVSNLVVVGGDLNSIQNSNDGYTNDKSKKLKTSFKYDTNEVALQPFEGDMLYEGRSGNSIRLSSTTENNDIYSVKSSSSSGTSKVGDPILVIRNGKLPKKTNIFNVENIDMNISSIWMTQGQTLNFKNPTTILDSQSRLGIDSYNTESNKNSGNQIGVFSDRIFIVSKNKEINLLAKNGIALSTPTSISVESGDIVELQSKRINLGIDANEPALLGDTTVDILTELLSELESICGNIMLLTVPTGTGPSLTPLNTANFIKNKANITNIKSKIDIVKSKLVFLNKN